MANQNLRLNAGTVLEYLKKPSKGIPDRFNFRSHYSKFDFKHDFRSNIIQSIFYSNGIGVDIYKNHIEGILEYLQFSFGATGKLVDRQNSSYDLVIEQEQNRTTVIVRFRYIAKIITTDREDINSQNLGMAYEYSMINKMNSLGYTKQTKPEDNESNADLLITVNGIDARIELKTAGAEFGSGTLEWYGNRWRLKITRKTNPMLQSILNENGILRKLSFDWYVYEYEPPAKATKESQGILGERSYIIDSSDIREYYSVKCDYLNFERHGLFRVSERDPLNLNVPLFSPTNCTARARVQSKQDEEGPFAYRISLTASGLPRSFLSLDGDLRFLEEINNNKLKV